jgi:hypothetical protein
MQGDMSVVSSEKRLEILEVGELGSNDGLEKVEEAMSSAKVQ